MAHVVYGLCALTSVLCAVLLARGYLKSRTGLLFWSSIGFAGLAVNNLILVADRLLVPDLDLSLWRNGVAFGAVAILLSGLIRENT